MGNYRKWVEISKSALKHNFELAKSQTSSSIMAVVKANAYGHGLIETTRLFIEFGASYIGVSSLGEALRLREAGINAPVLVLGFVQKDAQAVSLVAFVFMASFALIIHLKNRLIDFKAGIIIAVFGCIASVFSALLVQGISDGVLKILFGIFLIILSLIEFVNIFKRRKEDFN